MTHRQRRGPDGLICCNCERRVLNWPEMLLSCNRIWSVDASGFRTPVVPELTILALITVHCSLLSACALLVNRHMRIHDRRDARDGYALMMFFQFAFACLLNIEGMQTTPPQQYIHWLCIIYHLCSFM